MSKTSRNRNKDQKDAVGMAFKKNEGKIPRAKQVADLMVIRAEDRVAGCARSKRAESRRREEAKANTREARRQRLRDIGLLADGAAAA